MNIEARLKVLEKSDSLPVGLRVRGGAEWGQGKAPTAIDSMSSGHHRS